MIRLLNNMDHDPLLSFVMKESAVNYFIILSLERSQYEEMYEKKWGQFDAQGNLIAVMLKRKTGNVQFYSCSKYDVQGFMELLDSEGFSKLMGEKSILKDFIDNYNFSKIEEGAFISKLEEKMAISQDTALLDNFKKLSSKDIDRVVDLYKKVFKGFAPRESMIGKLADQTGRGYYMENNNKIICTAQSSYENNDSAIIVGVATDPEFQNKGYATLCLNKLCSELLLEGKKLYLLYDNELAGNIYKKLGFEDIGRMLNCCR